MNFFEIDELPDPIQTMMAIASENLVAGQCLFHQGDCTRAIFVVVSGQISLMRYTNAGRAIKHYEVRTVESFAEAALFHGVYDCSHRCL